MFHEYKTYIEKLSDSTVDVFHNRKIPREIGDYDWVIGAIKNQCTYENRRFRQIRDRFIGLVTGYECRDRVSDWDLFKTLWFWTDCYIDERFEDNIVFSEAFGVDHLLFKPIPVEKEFFALFVGNDDWPKKRVKSHFIPLCERAGVNYHIVNGRKNWVGVRFRTWQNIAKELKEIKELGYEGIQFEDDAVWYDPKRDIKVFECLHDLELVWRAPMRADFVTAERAKIMASSGCREVFIGVESGSNLILSKINKEITVKQNRKALRIFHEAGIPVKIGIVLGLPGETDETVKETWKFCEEMEPCIIDFGITTLVPYPGSPIYDHPENFDIQFDKNRIYEPHTGGECIVSTSSLSNSVIADWRKAFYRRFKGREYA